MKTKGLLLSLFLLLPSLLFGQYTYQPFVKEGKVWHMYGYCNRDYWKDHYYDYVMRGDTIIGGEVMKKVHIVDEERFHNNEPHYIGAVKET